MNKSETAGVGWGNKKGGWVAAGVSGYRCSPSEKKKGYRNVL